MVSRPSTTLNAFPGPIRVFVEDILRSDRFGPAEICSLDCLGSCISRTGSSLARRASRPPGSEVKGGTGKAEDAKLPGAGISPKQCPRKCVAEKGKRLTKVSENRDEEQTRVKEQTANLFVTRGHDGIDTQRPPHWNDSSGQANSS